jgi:predicted RNA-binding Zn-ribbon protein involved in translation (DUF1610 family)
MTEPRAYAEAMDRRIVTLQIGVPPCPICGATTIRSRRRCVDRLLSAVISVRRYRCTELGCGWEGNVRLHRLPFPTSLGRY